jgi:hypothetical protein
MQIMQIVARPLPPTTYVETISDTTIIAGGVLVVLAALGIGGLVWWLRVKSR